MSSYGISGRRLSALGSVLAFTAMVLLGAIPMAGAALEETIAPETGTNGRLLKFSATNMSLVPAKSLISLTDNVKILQEKTVIFADNAQIFTTKNVAAGQMINLDSVEKFVANGNVRIELDNGVATSDKAVYFKETKRLVLSGEPAKYVGSDDTMAGTITGSTITMDRENGDRFEANGNVRIELENGVATSDKAFYFADTKRLVLSGTPAKLVGSDNTMTGTITGSTIIVNHETGMVSIEDAEGVIFPEGDL